MLVAGAVEIDSGKPRHARLKVIEGFGKPELHAFILGAVAPQTQLITDAWPSCQDLPSVKHKAVTLGPMAAHVALPWIHRLFSNLDGAWAFTTDCGKQTSTTSTNSCSALIGIEHAMLPSIPCSASVPTRSQLPTAC
jgi:hypothetical protein